MQPQDHQEGHNPALPHRTSALSSEGTGAAPNGGPAIKYKRRPLYIVSPSINLQITQPYNYTSGII